jgi:hypothetical protein
MRRQAYRLTPIVTHFRFGDADEGSLRAPRRAGSIRFHNLNAALSSERRQLFGSRLLVRSELADAPVQPDGG